MAPCLDHCSSAPDNRDCTRWRERQSLSSLVARRSGSKCRRRRQDVEQNGKALRKMDDGRLQRAGKQRNSPFSCCSGGHSASSRIASGVARHSAAPRTPGSRASRGPSPARPVHQNRASSWVAAREALRSAEKEFTSTRRVNISPGWASDRWPTPRRVRQALKAASAERLVIPRKCVGPARRGSHSRAVTHTKQREDNARVHLSRARGDLAVPGYEKPGPVSRAQEDWRG